MQKTFLTFFFLILLSSNAYAYIDPGSITIIFQAIIGAIAMLGTSVAIYWKKILEFFKIKKKDARKIEPNKKK